MRVPGRRHLTNRRGATLPLVALMLVALLSIVALVVDLGMLFAARGDAQRAADAAALAGASTYMDALSDPDTAEARALDWASRNQLLARGIGGDEVEVDVVDAQRTVHVRIERNFPLFFARIFGFDAAPVSAFASARVTSSGTANCIKPFGVPTDSFQDVEPGDSVLIWEQRGSEKDEDFGGLILVGGTSGRTIFDMIVDTECSSQVSVGDPMTVQPSNNTVGNPTNALKNLQSQYGRLFWTEDGAYDGFNKEDWQKDPRVALIPTYDPGTWPGQPNGNVTVTGFIRIAIFDHVKECHHNPKPGEFECAGGGNTGKRSQVWATMIPASGITDTCELTGACADNNRALQLVR